MAAPCVRASQCCAHAHMRMRGLLVWHVCGRCFVCAVCSGRALSQSVFAHSLVNVSYNKRTHALHTHTHTPHPLHTHTHHVVTAYIRTVNEYRSQVFRLIGRAFHSLRSYRERRSPAICEGLIGHALSASVFVPKIGRKKNNHSLRSIGPAFTVCSQTGNKDCRSLVSNDTRCFSWSSDHDGETTTFIQQV